MDIDETVLDNSPLEAYLIDTMYHIPMNMGEVGLSSFSKALSRSTRVHTICRVTKCRSLLCDKSGYVRMNLIRQCRNLKRFGFPFADNIASGS